MVNCYILNDFPEIQLKGCEMTFDLSKQTPKPDNLSNSFTMRISPEETIEKNKMKLNLECSNSLHFWLDDVQNPDLLWYHYNENDQPLDLDNPEIEIEIGAYKGRFGWGTKRVTIESETNNLILFEGIMYNGILKG